MKEFLSAKGIDFQELNVAQNDHARNEMINKTGSMAVPTILVDDETVVGFDRERLEKLLQ